MTLQIELTAEQEAELLLVAQREAKTIVEVLLDRAFGEQPGIRVSKAETATERADRAWRELNQRRENRVESGEGTHLQSVKMDAEFLYSE